MSKKDIRPYELTRPEATLGIRLLECLFEEERPVDVKRRFNLTENALMKRFVAIHAFAMQKYGGVDAVNHGWSAFEANRGKIRYWKPSAFKLVHVIETHSKEAAEKDIARWKEWIERLKKEEWPEVLAGHVHFEWTEIPKEPNLSGKVKRVLFSKSVATRAITVFERYLEGRTQADLAREFDISKMLALNILRKFIMIAKALYVKDYPELEGMRRIGGMGDLQALAPREFWIPILERMKKEQWVDDEDVRIPSNFKKLD